MSEEIFDKNKKEEPGTQENPAGGGEDPGSYHLVYETIKPRSVNIKKRLQQVLWAALSAVLFGLIAAVIIAKLVPVFTPKEEPQGVHLTSGEETGEETAEGSEETEESGDITETPDSGDGVEDEGGAETTPGDAASEDDTDGEGQQEEEPDENAGDDSGDGGEDGPEEGSDEEPAPQEIPQLQKHESAQDRLEYNSKLFNDIRNIGNEARRSVVQVAGITTVEDWFENVDEDRALTSGAIIADDGLNLIIVTDGNVVENANSIAVTFYNDSVAVATFGKKDPVTGLATIRVSKNDMNPETVAGTRIAVICSSRPLVPGDQVIAVGSPIGFTDSIVFGQVTSASNTVSLPDREYKLVVTDIHGSTQGSGILVNLKGEITGIIAQRYCPLEDGGIVTALPIGEISGLIEDLSNNRDIARLGITGETVTSDISVNTGVPLGVYVIDVELDSPAFVAGIQRGDIINEIGGVPITSMHDIQSTLTPDKAGNVIPVKFKRSSINGYSDMELEVELGSE